MRLNDNPVLAKGQIWRTRAAAIEIMGLNACFIYYKVTKKLGRRWVSAQVSGLQAMADYLKTNRARLTTGRSRR